MAGKTRPVLLKQIIDKLDEMEQFDNPQLSKTKRNCIRELVNEKFNEKNELVEKNKEIERLNNMLHDSFQGHLLNELQRKDKEIARLIKLIPHICVSCEHYMGCDDAGIPFCNQNDHNCSAHSNTIYKSMKGDKWVIRETLYKEDNQEDSEWITYRYYNK